MTTQHFRSYIELSSSALEHNCKRIAAIRPAEQLGAVVKSDAYGHGIIQISSMLESVDVVRWLCVVGIEEAVRVRLAGSTKKLLVMAYHDFNLDVLLHYDIDIAVYDTSQLDRLNALGRSKQRMLRVHLKVDTGLIRLGFSPCDVQAIMAEMKTRYPFIAPIGIFTHLADPNNPDLSFTHQQLADFEHMLDALFCAGFSFERIHALSSGGLTLSCSSSSRQSSVSQGSNPGLGYNYGMVRVGTNMYGFWKSEIQRKRFFEFDPTFDLKPVLSWKSRIESIFSLKSGESVGYDRVFRAASDRRIALIPVGYSDGYPVAFAQRSFISVNGLAAPVVGVEMGALFADVTHITSACRGSDVILIGGHSPVFAHELAAHFGTINNEIATRLSVDIKRVIID